jgi:hypothetical protein
MDGRVFIPRGGLSELLSMPSHSPFFSTVEMKIVKNSAGCDDELRHSPPALSRSATINGRALAVRTRRVTVIDTERPTPGKSWHLPT